MPDCVVLDIGAALPGHLPICSTRDMACLPRDFLGMLGWMVLTLTLLGSHRKRHKMTMAVVRVTRDVL